MPVRSLRVLRWQQLPWESGYPPCTKKKAAMWSEVMHQCAQKERLLACDNGLTRYSQKITSTYKDMEQDESEVSLNNARMNHSNF